MFGGWGVLITISKYYDLMLNGNNLNLFENSAISVTWFESRNVFVSCWLFIKFNLFLIDVNFVPHNKG